MGFRQFTTKELIQYLRRFNFTRTINQWHIHHTFQPSYKDFNGSNHQALQEAMKNYHIITKGWQDIAQHFTLFPDGTWLLGRDLNMTPASIAGWNTGAIAVEMVGNFDIGCDVMTDQQKQAIIEMSSFMTKDLKLDMKFHRDSPTAGKTCPGSGIDRTTFFKEVYLFGSKVKTVNTPVKVRELKGWEETVISECLNKGIITDESWRDKVDEKIDVIHVLSMLNNLFNKLNH
jgi:hypothetical protein